MAGPAIASVAVSEGGTPPRGHRLVSTAVGQGAAIGVTVRLDYLLWVGVDAAIEESGFR